MHPVKSYGILTFFFQFFSVSVIASVKSTINNHVFQPKIEKLLPGMRTAY
jgi:hypothetical protein